MKYIQSFYQYPVTFSSVGKTIAARNASGEMKNIVEVSDKELDKLNSQEPLFRELLNKKKIRILNHIPASYIPAAQQVNNARAEAESAKAEVERLKAQLAEANAKLEAAEEKEEEEATEEDTSTKKATSKRKSKK